MQVHTGTVESIHYTMLGSHSNKTLATVTRDSQ
jgi:hypothetical protein